MYDVEKKIDRQSMLMYKANLGLLSDRYSDIERRVLEYFAQNPTISQVTLPGAIDLVVYYLIRDGFLVHDESYSTRATADGFYEFDIVVQQTYCITSEGREFVCRWVSGEPLT